MERKSKLFLSLGGVGSSVKSFDLDKLIGFTLQSETFIETNSLREEFVCYLKKDTITVKPEKIEIDDYEYKTPVWVRAYYKATKKEIFVFPHFSSTNFVVEIVNEFAELMLTCIFISFYVKKKLSSRNFAVF